MHKPLCTKLVTITILIISPEIVVIYFFRSMLLESTFINN